MNNDDFKEVPDNIQDNNEETTNNIDNTNDNKANDYEDVCYICRRPESVAGKMIHIQPNLCICNDCMQKTFDSMSNGNFGNLGNLGNISNMDFGNMPNISMINLSDLTGGIPNSQKLKKKKPKEGTPHIGARSSAPQLLPVSVSSSSFETTIASSKNIS